MQKSCPKICRTQLFFVPLQCNKEKGTITIKTTNDMRRTYAVMSESNGVTEVVFTSTRKAEIEKTFRRWIKGFKKRDNYFVSEMNMGYAIVTYIGPFAKVETEYYITSKIN